MSFIKKIFGGEAPDKAQYRRADTQQSQRTAIQGNLDVLPDVEALVSRVNQGNQQQAIDLMEQAVPGFGAMQQRFMDLANSSLDNRYDVPDEVSENIRRLAAERGVDIGGGGQFREFSLLRDLGVNSLQYGAQRLQEAQGLYQQVISSAPRINPVSSMAFMVNPQQQFQNEQSENRFEYNVDQAYNNAKTAASNNMWNNIRGTVMSVAGLVTGMPGGGGAGGEVSAPTGYTPPQRDPSVGSSFYQPQSMNVQPFATNPRPMMRANQAGEPINWRNIGSTA